MKIKRLTAEVEFEVTLTNTDIDVICKAIVVAEGGLQTLPISERERAHIIRVQFRNHVLRGGIVTREGTG